MAARRTSRGAAALLLTLLIAGCGGGDTTAVAPLSDAQALVGEALLPPQDSVAIGALDASDFPPESTASVDADDLPPAV